MTKLLFLPLLFLSMLVSAQSETSDELSEATMKDLLEQLNMKNMAEESKGELAQAACLCIDSIRITNKSTEDVSKEIGECIESSVNAYALMDAMSQALLSTDSTNTINVNINQSTTKNKKIYYEIERWLRDSCTSLNEKIRTDEKQSLNSVSDNEEALKYYYAGQDAFKQRDMKKAARLYQKAVDLDENFAFALDNLGLTYRHLKKYDKALAAYKKSLKVSPSGSLPLQNIPIVYEHMNNFDKALQAYNDLLKKEPDNPEGYFGKGRVLFAHFKKKEAALHSMCQAYNIYKRTNNPYRADAEQVMAYIYEEMKQELNGRDKFNEILEEYKIQIRFAD